MLVPRTFGMASVNLPWVSTFVETKVELTANAIRKSRLFTSHVPGTCYLGVAAVVEVAVGGGGVFCCRCPCCSHITSSPQPRPWTPEDTRTNTESTSTYSSRHISKSAFIRSTFEKKYPPKHA